MHPIMFLVRPYTHRQNSMRVWPVLLQRLSPARAVLHDSAMDASLQANGTADIIQQLVSALPAPLACGTHLVLLAESRAGMNETGVVITCDGQAVERPHVNRTQVDKAPTFIVGTVAMCKV